MLFLIGVITVLGCVITGFLMDHGKLQVLWQPNEWIIIFGASIGAFLIANPGEVIKDVLHGLKKLFKGTPYKKKDYLELLMFLFNIFKLTKSKGMLVIESHIENPHESELFKTFPSILRDHHVVDFICDYMRLLAMGVDNHFHMEDLMDKEIEVHHHQLANAAGAVTNMGDGMPALGIVAAVLGVIITMGSIDKPPTVLGELIGAALVGTFSGVLLSYGFVSPIGSFLSKFGEAETSYYTCIKAGIISHMQGNAPTITVEFVRKQIPVNSKPSFKEVEDALNGNEKGEVKQ